MTIYSKGENGGYQMTCPKCKKVEQLSGYPIAQLGGGKNLVFTCECKNQIKMNAKQFNVFADSVNPRRAIIRAMKS